MTASRKNAYIADCGTCGKPIYDYLSNHKKTSSGKFYCSVACRVQGTIKPLVHKEESLCVTCKEVKQAREFYRDAKSKNNGGLQYSCRQCTKEQRKQYYDSNTQKVVERVQKYAKENPEVHRRHGRKQRQKETKEVRAARRALNAAVRKGTVIKPECCSRCSRSVRLYGHHHRGYEREFRLDVVWLCGSCHAAEHGRGPQSR